MSQNNSNDTAARPAGDDEKKKQAWRERNVPMIIGLGVFGLLGLLAVVVRYLNS